MRRHLGILIVLLVLLAAAGFIALRAWRIASAESSMQGSDNEQRPVAVGVAPVESGLIRDVRVLSGSLEARARFTVATKVSGLLKDVLVDIGDRVEREQVVAMIDDAEFVQAVAQAEAELAVREAERSSAESARTLSQREYDRALALKDRGIASESQLDEREAALESAKASLKLAEARVQQAGAALELSRIRLGYTKVKADWVGGPQYGTVAQRFQDAGNTVQVGDSIVSITSLNPLTAVVSVTEGDYGRLAVGQTATLTTDAQPGREFEARVARIAPVFRESSRQARIELEVENPESLLRPGMFIRVRIVLRESDASTIVPVAALVERGGQILVFVVNDDGDAVRAVPVEPGIRHNERVEILSPTLAGRVVVLGQQLLEDGSPITIGDSEPGSGATGE